MKLKIIKDIVLANPDAAKPHWDFKKDIVIETDNEHLIGRLLSLKVAKILEKESNTATAEVKEIEIPVEEKAVEEEHDNKMFKPTNIKNKRKRGDK